MYIRSSSIALAIACLSGINALPHERRAVIAHDAVVGFPETVPSGDLGSLYLKYKPFLYVANGCVPFPAVNAAGDTSGGLSQTGSPEGGCSSSTGQVYVRSAQQDSGFAIMYAWYMPKDSPSSGLGHRHEWENTVVWLSSSDPSTATLLGVAASQHGDYVTDTTPAVSGPGGPRIKYESIWPVNHSLWFTDTVGGQQPLIAWESLTDAARTALQNTDFGDATVSIKDGHFEELLALAVL